jgi:hypothetical protein
MKKKLLLFVSVALLLIAGVVAAAVYKAGDIVTAYKPQIEKILSENLRAQVRLDGLHLSIFPRPRIGVSKLEIRDLQGKDSGVSIGSLEAQAALWPLLSKRLELSSVAVIRPVIKLKKTPTGVSVQGIEPGVSQPKSATQAGSPTTAISANSTTPLGLSIERIVVREGVVDIEDAVHKTTHSLKQIELDMGLEFSGEDLRIPKGTLTLVAQGNIPIAMTVADATFNKASGAARLPECRVTLPPGTLTISGKTSSLDSGTLSLSADSLDLAKLMLLAGAFSPAASKIKPTGQLSLLLDHDIAKGVTNVKTATLKGFGGTITAPSTVTLGDPVKASTQVDITSLSIAELVKTFAPHLAGVVDGSITRAQSKLSGITANDPANTAAGGGSLRIANGVIKGLNIPGQALTKIDSLPFIVGSLRQRVPQEFEPLFSKQDTVIKELSSNFSISRGVLQLSDFNLASDYFSVRGGGTYSLLGETNVKADLILSPPVSSGITSRVKELQPLVDPSGQLVLPLTISGKLPAVLVTPDLNAILKKASVAGVAQALDKVLKDKKVGGKLGKILGF